jgi:hypothetical protein
VRKKCHVLFEWPLTGSWLTNKKTRRYFIFSRVVINHCAIIIYKRIEYNEWGSTARNLIARQLIGRHFWQEINCSTQNFSTARIELSQAQPDSSSWHFFLVQHINWKSQSFTYRDGQFFYQPNLPNLPFPNLT